MTIDNINVDTPKSVQSVKNMPERIFLFAILFRDTLISGMLAKLAFDCFSSPQQIPKTPGAISLDFGALKMVCMLENDPGRMSIFQGSSSSCACLV